MTRKKWSWFTIVNYAVLSLLIVICLPSRLFKV